jgi:hypothetical protein
MRRFASDALVAVGLGSLGYGFWLVHPSLMFLGVGAAVLYLGIWTYRRANKE